MRIPGSGWGPVSFHRGWEAASSAREASWVSPEPRPGLRPGLRSHVWTCVQTCVRLCAADPAAPTPSRPLRISSLADGAVGRTERNPHRGYLRSRRRRDALPALPDPGSRHAEGGGGDVERSERPPSEAGAQALPSQPAVLPGFQGLVSGSSVGMVPADPAEPGARPRPLPRAAPGPGAGPRAARRPWRRPGSGEERVDLGRRSSFLSPDGLPPG